MAEKAPRCEGRLARGVGRGLLHMQQTSSRGFNRETGETVVLQTKRQGHVETLRKDLSEELSAPMTGLVG